MKKVGIPNAVLYVICFAGKSHIARRFSLCVSASSRVSQELAKATNDWVWCGAAIEGLVSAKVLETPWGLSSATGGSASTSASVGAAAAAATAGQGHHQRRGRSISSAVPAGGSGGAPSSSGWPSWEALRTRGVEADVRELLAEARACYKKKGGVIAMQVRCGHATSRREE